MDLTTISNFAAASNRIEGEQTLTHKQVEITSRAATQGYNSLFEILSDHAAMTAHLGDWGGKWRTDNVRVGSWIAPDWQKVPDLMAQFWDQWEAMDAWEAHNRFVKIHPFLDYNGRMARLIWLAKMVDESNGEMSDLPFLHQFYYQTLRHL